MKLKIVCLGLTGLILMMMTACASVQKRGTTSTETPQLIEDISVTDYPDYTEVVVVGQRPMIYTTFRLTDPERLIVDIAGVSYGELGEKMEVNQGSLVSILLVEGEKPSYVARLEMGLVELVESNVRSEGSKLVIAIDKPMHEEINAPGQDVVEEIEVAREVEEIESVAPMPSSVIEEEETELPKAKVVSGLVVEPEDERGLKVIISGDGKFSPEVFMVGKTRLVVDLQDVTNTIIPNTIPIKHALVEKIRIGQHVKPKKARVVLDLTGPITYDFYVENQQFIIAIGTVSEPSVESPMVAGVVPVEEEAPKPEPVEPAVSAPEPSPVTTPEPTPVTKYAGKKISLDFQDAELGNVLRLLADVSGLNIVIGTDVRGQVTIKLINVPWDQALGIILKMNNLGQIREGNILHVDTLDNIARQLSKEAAARDAGVIAEELVTRILPVNYADASELAETLQKSLSPRGSITIDQRTNTLIIKDVETRIVEILELAKTLDTQTPQVLIEARIVQADTSFAQSLGISWGATFTDVNSNNVTGVQGGTAGGFNAQTPGFAIDLPATVSGLQSVPGVGFTFGRFTDNPINLDLRLSAGELSGLTKTISSPRIITLDNRQAKIEQGESIPFQTTSLQGTQTTFVDANLVLEVTPHVTRDGSILMSVKAARNSLGSFSGPAGPSISKREATTEILLKDGETTVIGGIFLNETNETQGGLPWLSKIPVLGWLFKNITKTETKNELLIFITPKIIQD
jgi:type IV pilus assembly protein PilQ